jgi:hypothetical protein
MTNKKFLLFCSTAFILCSLFEGIAFLALKKEYSDKGEFFLTGIMGFQAFLTLIFLIKYKSLRNMLSWKPSAIFIREVALAILLPIFVSFISLFIIQQIGNDQLREILP